jgi:hypothetical protein
MIRSKDRWLENIQMNDIENIEWIDSLTEVELKGELLERVKLVETLRRHRDTLIEVVYEHVWSKGETIGVSNEEIGTRASTMPKELLDFCRYRFDNMGNMDKERGRG